MHFALALILMFGVLVFAGNYGDSKATTTLDLVEKGSPAAKAGLQKGDQLVAVDGTRIDNWDDLRPQLLDRGGDTVNFTVERDGESVDIPVTLATIKNPNAGNDPNAPKNLGRAGIAPTVHVPSVNPAAAVIEAPRQVWSIAGASVSALGDRFSPSGISSYWHVLTTDNKDTNSPQASSERFVSVVGFGRLAIQATESGWVQVAFLLISINVFVGIFNLVPLLPVRRRPHRDRDLREDRVDDPAPPGAGGRRQAAAGHRGGDERARVRVPVEPVPRHHPPVEQPVLVATRRVTRQLQVGSVAVGGDAPISMQSMTTTKTADVDGTLAQIYALAAAGCDIVRCTCNEEEAAEGLAQIVPRSPVPIVADIHFQYKLALGAMEAGVQALRLNPGNIRKPEHIKLVAREAKDRGLPIRIGVNAGSLDPAMAEQHGGITPEALVASAMHELDLFREVDFDDVKISVKASNVPLMIDAYRLLSETTDHPLHLGVTEAGPPPAGLVKSIAGIGTLLSEGIGDTIRFSLTADPVEEAKAGRVLLEALGLRERKGLDLIACPSCGRAEVDVIGIASDAQAALEERNIPLQVAVMGCVVNGPGEAREADLGIAGRARQGSPVREGQGRARRARGGDGRGARRRSRTHHGRGHRGPHRRRRRERRGDRGRDARRAVADPGRRRQPVVREDRSHPRPRGLIRADAARRRRDPSDSIARRVLPLRVLAVG